MKKSVLWVFLAFLYINTSGKGIVFSNSERVSQESSTENFLILLANLRSETQNSFFRLHCNSIIEVINSRIISEYEQTFIDRMYDTFNDTSVIWNAKNFSSYFERKRPLIISWKSPTDEIVSMAWLVLPENWDSTKSYPAYVTLHGLYNPYSDPIEYMARYLTPETIMERSFEDGYILFPWGRGNLWYEGIGETDVWESIEALEKSFKINPNRKYLMGHSMGGYGAWVIGQKSPEVWAALGIHAGALWYSGSKYLNSETAQNLKDTPVYIICGTQDGLLGNNQTAYNLLQSAGNTNIAFETFNGGHEALLENWRKMYEWIRNFSRGTTDVKDKSDLPGYILYNNYPNPFNPSTSFRFRISDSSPQSMLISLKIYDALGRETQTIVSKELSPGEYEFLFDGGKLASGIYLYVLRAGNNILSKKMCLLK